MIVLIIIGILLLLLAALMLLRIRFDIIASEEITVRLNICGIKIPIYPQNRKKVSPKKFKKGYPSKSEKKKAESKKKSKPAPLEEKIPLGDKIDTIIALLKLLFSRFFKHLRLDVSRIIVIVGGSDAASCAITYGIVSQSVAFLLEFLDNNLKISKKRGGKIDVLCDFTSESTVYDIFISASLTSWQILDIGITLAYNYFTGKDIFNLKKRF